MAAPQTSAMRCMSFLRIEHPIAEDEKRPRGHDGILLSHLRAGVNAVVPGFTVAAVGACGIWVGEAGERLRASPPIPHPGARRRRRRRTSAMIPPATNTAPTPVEPMRTLTDTPNIPANLSSAVHS